MATKPTTGLQVWKVGDRVKIRYTEWSRARIVELRGPLGPGGAEVYRVRVRRKPQPMYIEVLGDQLLPRTATAAKPGKPKSDA
jgi:hypothetical protein